MSKETQVDLSQILSQVKLAPNIDGLNLPRHRDLLRFTNGIFYDFAAAVDSHRLGNALPPRLVVIFDGPPGDGKSFLIDIFNEKAESWGEGKYKKILMDMAEGSMRWLSKNPWEITGLRAAREEGAITTGRFELANSEGLKRANELHEVSMARSVRESYITTAEQVDAAGIVIDHNTNDFFKRYSGRAMGNDAGRNLFTRSGSFEGMSEEFNVLPYVIGVAGGKKLEVKADERWEMQDAKSVSDARLKARKYGSEGPADIDELYRMQTQGASREQMIAINQIIREQIGYLKQVGSIVERGDVWVPQETPGIIWLPDKVKFDTNFYKEITKVVGMAADERRFSAYVREAVTAVLQIIYEKDFKLARGSKRYGIFINNPTWQQLNIGLNERKQLKRSYRKKEMLTGRN